MRAGQHCRPGTMRFRTLNSTYEVDAPGKRIRRLTGTNDPTPRQGADSEWKDYASIARVLAPGSGELSFFIDWDGLGHGTWTSAVQEVTE